MVKVTRKFLALFVPPGMVIIGAGMYERELWAAFIVWCVLTAVVGITLERAIKRSR